MIKDAIVLEGQVVRLEPLEPHHIDPLMAIAIAKPELYQFTSTPINDEQRQSYFDLAFKTRDEGSAYPFVMRHLPSERIVGTTRFYQITWPYRNGLIGYTWFDHLLFGSALNVESKYLMLQYAFERLDFIRVQFNTDTRNKRSEAAILALGASYEGTLRASQVNKDGHVRDNMIFSIIASEWPQVKRLLEQRLKEKLTRSADLLR
ncbi:MAG: GNAT family protein [Deinococcales bacterium]